MCPRYRPIRLLLSCCKLTSSDLAGLYLPTSDIDLVVMDSGADDIKIALRALSNKLSNTGIAIKIQV